jgi:hypothetical protein
MPKTFAKANFFNQIISYEEGKLSEEETLDLFQYLLDTGMCWTLQGHYGRTAANLIEAGLIHKQEKA